MLETSARLLRLLSLLQTHRDWSGAELADRLGITPRTVRRDVDKLRSLGYPVHASTGSAGGYRLGAGAALPPLLLDDEEAVAVAVGLRTAAGGAVTGIEETSVRALAKLEQVLPDRLRRRVRALTAYTVAVPGRPGPTVDAEVLITLTAACRDNQRLRFDYVAHDGTASVRDTEPHRLVCWGRRWYLLAWDTDRTDWRIFRVDRVRPRVPGGPRFAPREPPAEDLADYVSRRVSAAWHQYTARVRLHAPLAELSARLPRSVGELSAEDDEHCLLTAGADRLDWLAAMIAVLGVDFDVLDPPELRAELRRIADRFDRAISPR
jgi:predicted DNA-binding transcriptional regulator YafY